MTTARCVSWLAVATLLVCSTGCLDFEQQAIVLVFPKDGKSVQALFVYSGLHVRRADGEVRDKQEDLKRAKNELAELVRGASIIFGDPLLRIPLKLKPGEKFGPEGARYFKIFQSRLTMEPGLFLTSEDGKFTYCQPITLHEPQQVMTELNQAISDSILKKLPNDLKLSKDPLAKEGGAILLKAAKDGHAWIKLTDGRLSVALPGTIKTLTQTRRELFDARLLEGLRRDVEALANAKPEAKTDGIRKRAEQKLNDLEGILAFLGETPLSVEQRPKQVTIALGWGDHEPFVLAMPVLRRIGKMREVDQELFTYAKTLNVPVRGNLALEDVLSGFLRTGKLPK